MQCRNNTCILYKTNLFPFFHLFNLQLCDDYSVIGRSLFKKETNIQMFVGLKVKLSTGEEGVIEGGFGQSGKFKVRILGKYLFLSLFYIEEKEFRFLCM